MSNHRDLKDGYWYPIIFQEGEHVAQYKHELFMLDCCGYLPEEIQWIGEGFEIEFGDKHE